MSDWWNFYSAPAGWELKPRLPMFAPRDSVLREEYNRRHSSGELPQSMEYRHYVWMWKKNMDIKKS